MSESLNTVNMTSLSANIDFRTLLYLTPAISSTCSLWYAWDQHYFLNLLTRPDLGPFNKKILPVYFQTYMEQSVLKNFALIITTILSSSAVIYTSPATLLQERGSRSLYQAGIGLAISHYLFAFILIPRIRAIQSNTDQAVAELGKLLRLHAFRTMTLELACCLCCVAAATKTLSL